eukprot:g8359.t1
MRVSYRRQQPAADGQIPDFLRSEFVSGTWERTGFDVDFPAIAKDPVVAAAVGYKGTNFLANSVDITRWYNRATRIIAGSVVFSSGCEGPPGMVHGGAVSSALDDILGTMVWREAGFSRWGIPTMQLTVRFRGATPMERQLRFDTRVVKREGRKVFVEASLRDPACGNKLLAEGEGLFFMRRPPPPPPTAPHPAVRVVAPPPSPSPASSSSSSSSALASSTSSGVDASGAGLPGGVPPSSSRSPSERTSSTHAPPATTRDLLPYDEAIREFGPGNPDAAANLVVFYGGDLSLLNRTAKL